MELYSIVALKEDKEVDEFGENKKIRLKKDTEGVIVDILSKGKAYIVEFPKGDTGEALALPTLKEDEFYFVSNGKI